MDNDIDPPRAEDLLRLFDMSSDLLAIVGRDGFFRRLNPAWETVLGWSLEELRSKPAVDFVHPDDLESTLDLYSEDQPGPGEVIGFENRYRCKDGGYRWLLWSARTDGERWYAIAKDVTERKQLEQRAQLDPLTKLPNRLTLTDRLSEALERASAESRSVLLAFIDIDQLKLINDGFGHEFGDHLLEALAGRLAGCLGADDLVSRFGGDEFVAVQQCEGSDAPELAERILAAFEQPFELDGEQVDVGLSIGLAASRPRIRPEELLREAEVAMYQAKARGGRSWAFFDDQLRQDVLTRRRIEVDMRHVLERRELRLHYQPIAPLVETAQASFEALLRWDHPTRGLLPPDQFILIAEENGQIVPIGDWVLGEACRQAQVWRSEGWDVQIAVNVSARQLESGDFAERVGKISAGAGLPCELICIELTESSLLADMDGTVPILERLRDMGVRIAVDDFGRGFSSLSYLKSLPVDVIKIDRSFIADVAESREDQAVISAVLSLAESLGISVIAEGVETAEQLTHLRDLGCPMVQGFFFARPAPPNEVALEKMFADYPPSKPRRVTESTRKPPTKTSAER